LQSVLGIFDVIGVLLTGVIAGLAMESITNIQKPIVINSFLEFFGLESMDAGSVILLLSIVALCFFLLKTFLALAITRVSFKFLASQQSKLSMKLSNGILNAEYSWLRSQEPHYISTTLISGVSAATSITLGHVMLIIAEFFLVFLFLILLFIVNPILAICTFLYLTFVLFVMNFLIGKKVEKFNQNMTQLKLKSQIGIFNVVRLFREIRVLRRTHWFQKDLNNTFNLHSRNLAADIWVQQIPKYAIEIALLIGTTGILVLGRFTANSEEVIPLVAIYLAGATRIFPSLLRIQSSVLSLRAFSSLSIEVHNLMGQLKIPVNGENESDGEINKISEDFHFEKNYDIRLKDLYFNFPNEIKPILNNINCSISLGDRVAIVGPSGAGKSTLCDLLLGLLEPTHGTLTIGGLPSRAWVDSHAGKISYLPQDVILISGTLRQNICIGIDESEIRDDLLNKTIERAQLQDLLEELPEGVDTYLGEGGYKLSGGQRQRVAIARALYSDPKILVMDEATSALDAQSENAVMEVIRKLGSETIVIFIAHRLSSIRNFDRVMYLDEGEIKGDGTFESVKGLVPQFAHQATLLGL
jgi:ABC-type multidrug transport system fused ATPase/permease subunit